MQCVQGGDYWKHSAKTGRDGGSGSPTAGGRWLDRPHAVRSDAVKTGEGWPTVCDKRVRFRDENAVFAPHSGRACLRCSQAVTDAALPSR